MKFFEAVPGELFSPLASPNRALYADALDVLYTAYRENLKIREDTLYSMLRSRLEQQLADATFEGEDIDEEELRDISGRARFLIRKLCGKGWFEKERGDDFEEYITVPSYSSRLLELFHQLRDDRPARGFSYVFGTYSALKVANESESVYDKMAAIYSAYDNTSALINLLQMVYHNVKHYFQMQIDMQDVNQVLASHFNEFGQKVVEAYIRPLKIKDSVPKYRVPIQSVLRSWAEDDALLLAMANAALQDKRGDTVENCRSDLLQKIFWIDERYDNIEHDYLDEIDAQVRRYIPAWKKRLCRTIKEAMENCATREEFIAFMAEYGYKVRWEPNQKYITYTTPENIRCRDNKLFDQTLLRSSMEAYFDMGGCEYLESRIDATEYGELLPTVDDAVCGLISILDAMNTGDNNRFHLETLHHSKQEIRRILERGGKIDRTVEYAVDDEEEEYEQYHGFSMRM